MLLIAGDIGGTKTLLSLFETSSKGFKTLYAHRFASGDFPSFDAVVSEFISEVGTYDIEALCLGIAGPVNKNGDHYTAQATNLPWELDSHKLSTATGIKKIALINDFAAMGYGVTVMEEQDLITLQDGENHEDGHRMVLGAGTGLGVAQLISLNNQYHVVASEGGHSNFAPFDKDTAALSEYYIERNGYCSIEQVLSGPGITHIFQFVCDATDTQTSLPSDADAAAIATAESDTAASKTMQIFTSIYGSVAGNLALTNLAFGGVYLTGGVAAKNSQLLQSKTFIEAFQAKGKMSRLMPKFPVHIVTNEQCGLLGAAVAASRL